jgi:hypothetical protein
MASGSVDFLQPVGIQITAQGKNMIETDRPGSCDPGRSKDVQASA